MISKTFLNIYSIGQLIALILLGILGNLTAMSLFAISNIWLNIYWEHNKK